MYIKYSDKDVCYFEYDLSKIMNKDCSIYNKDSPLILKQCSDNVFEIFNKWIKIAIESKIEFSNEGIFNASFFEEYDNKLLLECLNFAKANNIKLFYNTICYILSKQIKLFNNGDKYYIIDNKFVEKNETTVSCEKLFIDTELVNDIGEYKHKEKVIDQYDLDNDFEECVSNYVGEYVYDDEYEKEFIESLYKIFVGERYKTTKLFKKIFNHYFRMEEPEIIEMFYRIINNPKLQLEDKNVPIFEGNNLYYHLLTDSDDILYINDKFTFDDLLAVVYKYLDNKIDSYNRFNIIDEYNKETGENIPSYIHVENETTLIKYLKNDSTIVIPNYIKEISEKVFFNKEFQIIELPDSIEKIGKFAFDFCTNLKYLTLPPNLKIISKFLCYDCFKLISVNIPDSVKVIDVGAFMDCEELQYVNIPNSIEVIKNCAFMNCKKLKNIYIPNTVKKIEEGVFNGCDSLNPKLKDYLIKKYGKEIFKEIYFDDMFDD